MISNHSPQFKLRAVLISHNILLNNLHRVGDSGDRFSLLAGGSGHQRTGGAEQQSIQRPLLKPLQNIGAKHAAGASAA